MRSPAPRYTITQSRPNDHPLRHQVTTQMPTRTYLVGFACSVRWAASPRETERRVHHGGRQGTLQSLAPTRSNAHARVPTHNSVTCTCMRPHELNLNRPIRISLAAGPRHLSRPLTAETARMTGLTQATPPCERRQRPQPGTAVRGDPRPQAGQPSHRKIGPDNKKLKKNLSVTNTQWR